MARGYPGEYTHRKGNKPSKFDILCVVVIIMTVVRFIKEIGG